MQHVGDFNGGGLKHSRGWLGMYRNCSIIIGRNGGEGLPLSREFQSS